MSLADTRKGLNELQSKLLVVSSALKRYFEDALDNDNEDGYAIKMFKFVGQARSQLQSLEDRVTLAESAFSSVLTAFDEKSDTQTTDFFGHLNQFLASYKQAQTDNISQAEAKALAERRKAERERMAAPAPAKEGRQPGAAGADSGARVDDFLASLRSKPDLGRRAQRRAGKPAGREKRLSNVASPTTPAFTTREGDPVDKAKGLLAQLTGNEVSERPHFGLWLSEEADLCSHCSWTTCRSVRESDQSDGRSAH